jgi:opacity protein-like surface antigen
MKKMFFAAAAATAFISTAASAAVIFDSSTGNGFVGKGDIQVPMSWNDQALQRNASGVTFVYSAEETYAFDCTFTVIIGRDRVPTPQLVTRHTDSSVNATVAYDARKNAQLKITGFNLNGFGAVTSSGDAVPVDGGYCPGGVLNDGTISNVSLVSSTGGLSFVYAGVPHELPVTPTL